MDDVNKAGAKPVIGRPFVKGQAPVSPGRPRLPDWFKAKGVDALRVLSAAATGTVDDMPDPPPAALQVATESSAKERLAASMELANRVFGKAPDVITGDADNPIRAAIEVRFVKPGE